jgi:hypothetical protein
MRERVFPACNSCGRSFFWITLMKMKRNSGIVLLSLGLGAALLVTFAGCAQQDDSYVPGRRAGFRPQTTPLMQDDFGAPDPLAVPSGALPVETPAGLGFAGGLSAGSSLPDPAPLPPPNPAPQVESRPIPLPPPPPAPAPAPPPASSGPAKSSGPEYAKRVPGKPNWIKSPYDGTILDATDQNGVRFPPGTEVKDPKGRVMLVP